MLAGSRPAAPEAVRNLIEALGAAGKAIIAYESGAFSANLCGHLRLARDGEDPDALRLTRCECHFHLKWRDVASFELLEIDVGYGDEPTLLIGTRGGQDRLRVHFQPEARRAVRRAFAAYNAAGASSLAPGAVPACIAPLPVTSRRPADCLASDALLGALEGCGISIRYPGGRDWRTGEVESLEQRLTLFIEAWQDPEVTHLWAALGGYGSGVLLDGLAARLPAPAGHKTIIGASDVSELGVWLAGRFENVSYLHCFNFEDEAVWSIRREDLRGIFEILSGAPVPRLSFHCPTARGLAGRPALSGTVVPMNATAARSLVCRGLEWMPSEPVLFLEDVNEPPERLERLFDDLARGGLLERACAIVLGTFSVNGAEGPALLDEAFVADLVSARAAPPVLGFAEFGHTARRLPLQMGGRVTIRAVEEGGLLTLGAGQEVQVRAA